MSGLSHDELIEDASLAGLLVSLGAELSPRLGQGGEAIVFALDDERVLRVLHPGQTHASTESRHQLVTELGSRGAPFALPELLESGSFEGRCYTIERRLRGASVLDTLPTLERSDRNRLIEAHLDAAAAIGDLHLEPRSYVGDLMGYPTTVRVDSWAEFLVAKVEGTLNSVAGFEEVDPVGLATDMPSLESPGDAAFVHLDGFGGNMLAVGTSITAVIDFGHTSLVGDRRLDPLSAAVYLCAPPTTPIANSADRQTTMAWLRNAGLDDWFEPARRWLAAYWAWAVDDASLHRWCRSVLL